MTHNFRALTSEAAPQHATTQNARLLPPPAATVPEQAEVPAMT